MRKCKRVYLEAYTSVLLVSQEQLVSKQVWLYRWSDSASWVLLVSLQEAFYGRSVTVADREMVEMVSIAISCHEPESQ